MRRFPTKLIVLMLSAAACQQRTAQQSEPTLTSGQRAAITDSVRKATADFIAAVEHVDTARAAPFYSRSPDFTFASNGDVFTSWEAFQPVFREGWNGLRSQHIAVVNSKIAVISPTTVVETISASGSFVDTAGKKSLIDKAAITLIWVRDSSGWKILSFHQSFPPPRTQ
jgi:hypothetical protein